MEHTKYIYSVIIVGMILFCHLSMTAQNSKSNYNSFEYDYIQKNDSVVDFFININGVCRKVDIYTAGIPAEKIVPKFLGRYKDCFVFIRGYGQHYRHLRIFYVKNNAILYEDFENELCIESSKKEKYMFFFNGVPIKIIYDTITSKIRFIKLRKKKSRNYRKDIIIESCNGKFFIR